MNSLPAGLRLPQLELLLGCALNDIDLGVIDALVASTQPEDQVLEFKRESYEPGHMKEFVKDVAAFANAAGGLMILGLTEAKHAAAMRVDVDVTEAALARLRKAVARYMEPQIQDLWIAGLEGATPGQGVILVGVPRSDAAPHGVFDPADERATWWPIRRGQDTGWMTESELATRYRRRDLQQRERATVAVQVHEEGLARLATGNAAFLVLSAVPAGPGHWSPDKEASRSWLQQQFMRMYPSGMSTNTAVLRGRRRVIHSNEYQFSGRSDDWHLEFHEDGSTFAGYALGRPDQAVVFRRGQQPCIRVMREDLEKNVVLLLALAGHHALRAGAGGDLAVTAQLLPIDRDREVSWQHEDGGTRSQVGVPLGIFEPHALLGEAQVTGSLLLASPSPTFEAVPLQIAVDARELLASAYLVVDEILAEFNAADVSLLAADGTFDPSGEAAISHRSDVLKSWIARATTTP